MGIVGYVMCWTISFREESSVCNAEMVLDASVEKVLILVADGASTEQRDCNDSLRSSCFKSAKNS